jgi:topoisomerase-4 subunit A
MEQPVPAHRPGSAHSAQHERARQGHTPAGDEPEGGAAAFLDHRREVLVRRSRLPAGERSSARLEILDGYLIAYLNLDEVIRIIREEDEPKPKLIKAPSS